MKEKILILCYRRPYPVLFGGEIRLFQFIEMLSAYYEVDVLYLDDSTEPADLSGLYEKTNQAIPFRVPKLKRLLQAAHYYFLKMKPLQVGYFYSCAMQKWVNAHAKDYNKILCMHVRTIEFALQAKKKGFLSSDCQLYLDGIDAISMHYKHSYQVSKGIKKLINGMEYRRMEKYEKQAFESVDGSILISQRDYDYIVKELGAKCDPYLVYNYAIDYGYKPEIKKEPYKLFFMGKMSYQPNVDAMKHFVTCVFDRLKKDYPKLVFHIAGGHATDEVKALQSHDGVKVVGFIDDPSIEMQSATMVVAPMISGSGLQNKIIQAMYLGCPVVTTVIGADGLTGVSGKEIIISADDEELYQNLKKYLSPDMAEERQKIGANARQYIIDHYSYATVDKQIRQAFSIKVKEL